MSTRTRKKHVQLGLDEVRRAPDKRGKKSRAGRPRGNKVQHETRARFRADRPQHVTLRIAAGLESLRRDRMVRLLRRAIASCHKPWFRVVHFAALSNHVHLIVEAHDASHLARGVQGLAVRVARSANRLLDRSGRLFADRYFARTLTSPREVRNCLRYVLLNQRHHVTERVLDRNWIDPCSSAAWFDGWSRAIALDSRWKRELVGMAPPVARATVWLLTTGWRRYGPIAFDELDPRHA